MICELKITVWRGAFWMEKGFRERVCIEVGEVLEEVEVVNEGGWG